MPAIDEARAAQDRIDDLEQQLARAREDRDHAIHRALTEDGMNPPAVARALQTTDGAARVSVSLVRNVQRIQALLNRDRAS